MTVKMFDGKKDDVVLFRLRETYDTLELEVVDNNGNLVKAGSILSICQGKNGAYIRVFRSVNQDIGVELEDRCGSSDYIRLEF